jgi:hypothetical protein
MSKVGWNSCQNMSFWETLWINVIYMDLGDRYDVIASECDIMSWNTYDGLKLWSSRGLCLWLCRAMSVVWTNPLVATLGMSLTIPLAMLADMVVHGRHYSFIYILGSVQVLGIFPSSILCYLFTSFVTLLQTFAAKNRVYFKSCEVQ